MLSLHRSKSVIVSQTSDSRDTHIRHSLVCTCLTVTFSMLFLVYVVKQDGGYSTWPRDWPPTGINSIIEPADRARQRSLSTDSAWHSQLIKRPYHIPRHPSVHVPITLPNPTNCQRRGGGPLHHVGVGPRLATSHTTHQMADEQFAPEKVDASMHAKAVGYPLP